MKVKFALDKLKKVSPDLESVEVFTEYPGINGWVICLSYGDNACSWFSVDKVNESNNGMFKLTKEAVLNQLQYHEKHKASK